MPAILLQVSAGPAWGDNTIPIARFSLLKPGAPLPPEWEPLLFKKINTHTRYETVEDQGNTVVRATSAGSASGLIRRIRIDPKRYPILTWRWKVGGVYENGNVSTRNGDDYPARIYITFEYDPGKVPFLEKAKYEAARIVHGEYPPLNAINYIWASKASIGTAVPNPYTERAIMLVIQSGETRLNRWIEEERNVWSDYLRVFGHPPPAISGVAIMTDSDNTGESAVALYGDITFHPQ